MKERTIFFLILSLIFSCNTKFEKEKWQNGIEYDYPYREKMLNDLLNNYDLKGKNLSEIIKLLGNPNDFCDHNQYELSYRIKLIDKPESEFSEIKVKSLILKLDKSKTNIDSLTIVTKVYLTE